MKIREINVDNIVEFLNSRNYSSAYLTNMTYSYPGRFNLKDYENLIDELIRHFFDGITYITGEQFTEYIGGPICENKSTMGKVLRNVNELTFISMYSNIIINLYDRGEIDFSVKELPELYKFIVRNQNDIKKHPNAKEECTYLVNLIKNYLYGSSTNKNSKIYITDIDKVVKYYKDIYKLLPEIDGFIFADVDQLYFEDFATEQIESIIKELDIPYEIKGGVSFCYFNTRRYVSVVDGNIKVRGYDYPGKPNFRNRKNSEQYEMVKEIVENFEKEIRYNKIKRLKELINV